jgi:hypothetical protein
MMKTASFSEVQNKSGNAFAVENVVEIEDSGPCGIEKF